MSKRKIAQKTTLTSLAAMMAAAPIIASPAANAAEVPVTVTIVSVDQAAADVNGNGKLDTAEVANARISFQIPGTFSAGDSFRLKISDGYKASFGGSIAIPLASDPSVIIGYATVEDEDTILVEATGATDNMVPGSVAGVLAAALVGDLNDTINFDADAYPIAVNGVESGVSFVIPGRSQPDYSSTNIYSFNAGTPTLGPVGTLGYLANDGSGTAYFEFTPSDLSRWQFDTSIPANRIVGAIALDDDVNTASNPDRPNNKAWETSWNTHYEVVEFTAEKIVVKVTDIPADYAARVQLADAAGKPLVVDAGTYTVNTKVAMGSDASVLDSALQLNASTILKNRDGSAIGENYTYTANLVASVKAADGSFQDANEAASSVEVDKGATEVSREFQLRSKNTGTGVLTNPSIYLNGELVETVTTTVAAGDTFAYDTTKIVPVGAQTQDWEIRYENGPTVTDPTKTDTTFKKVPAIGLKALIGDADANADTTAVIYTVDSENGQASAPINVQIPNPGDLPIVNPTITSDSGFSKVLEGVTIQPGETYTAKLTDLALGVGVHTIEFTVTDAANGTSATDPVVAIVHADVVPENPPVSEELPKGVVLADDTIRVRVGDTITADLLANDPGAADGTALDPATGKVTVAEGWTANEDGTFTHESGLVVKYNGEGGLEVVKAPVEGKFGGLQYTAVTGASDIVAPANITVEVYDFHVGLKALIGEEQQDANGKDDAYTITITDETVETVTTPITLPVTNTGTEPITVTGFQQVNTSDGGAGFEITLDEPVTLAPGESFTYTYDIELPVGEHVIDYKVLTAEGAVATDPVYVDVVKEIVPNEAPSHAVPELTIEPTPETPVVEQEKPKAPTPVVPETGGKGVTVEAKTAAELAGSDAAVVASAQAAPAGFSVGKVVAGVLTALSALALAVLGVVTFRNRKAKDA